LELAEDGKLTLPAGAADQLPRGEGLRVIILVPEETEFQEDDAWNRLTAEQFFAGYSQADSVYDKI
jgi:hypothetical protein